MDTRSLGAWWAVPADELAARLGVDPARGLDTARVGAMRERYGSNETASTGPAGAWALLRESVTSPMMLLLLGIAIIALLLGQAREAVVMAFVVLAYVGVELINKSRTDRTMARLRALQAPEATSIGAAARLFPLCALLSTFTRSTRLHGFR